ncbi:hypothetical protein WD019_18080 [Fictibacillus sp. Mic-4]|uniref:hypothetical protein n=1 Tax=Fictibacillus sp. Mic-4 TaxID=3132826 RepID=UPI003CEC35F9
MPKTKQDTGLEIYYAGDASKIKNLQLVSSDLYDASDFVFDHELAKEQTISVPIK